MDTFRRTLLAICGSVMLAACAGQNLAQNIGIAGTTFTTPRNQNPVIGEKVRTGDDGIGLTSAQVDRRNTFILDLHKSQGTGANVLMCSQTRPPVSVDTGRAFANRAAAAISRTATEQRAEVQAALESLLTIQSRELRRTPRSVQYLDEVRASLCEYFLNLAALGTDQDSAFNLDADSSIMSREVIPALMPSDRPGARNVFAALEKAIVKAGEIAAKEVENQPIGLELTLSPEGKSPSDIINELSDELRRRGLDIGFTRLPRSEIPEQCRNVPQAARSAQRIVLGGDNNSQCIADLGNDQTFTYPAETSS